jgi:Fe2+ transport system protein B
MLLNKKIFIGLVIFETLISALNLITLNYNFGSENYGLLPDTTLNIYYIVLWVMLLISCLAAYLISNKFSGSWKIFLISVAIFTLLSWCFAHYYLIDKLFIFVTKIENSGL